MESRFHLAFPVKDIDATRKFYEHALGCEVGRSTETWIDFNFYGHQLSAHVVHFKNSESKSFVDGDPVPIPHFGVIVDYFTFDNIATRLQSMGHTFLVPPQTRFSGQPGEQRTMFFLDPSGNAIEIKAFANEQAIFNS